MPALMPEWAYGHWKSRDVYEHQDDVEDDWRGYREADLPLDAIVIDSPWETQYNTWRSNFGKPPGSGLGSHVSATVPEPTALILLMFAAASRCLLRSRTP